MSTGVTLATLIADVQFELGHSTVTTVGQNFRAHIIHRLNREYERLYRDFSWPHLRKWADLALVAGTKTYTLPSIGGDPLTLGDLREVYAKWGGIWTPIKRGIEITDYNAFDSDGGVRNDPAQKWAPASETQIEVWPVPASVGTVRLLALTPFKPMVLETDTCRLDDQLVALFAAGELLTRQGAKEAGAVMLRAQQHYMTLKQRLQTGANKVSLARGEGPDPNDPRSKVFYGVGTVQGTP
jgi:hypothetical protein